ncbi:hypothetical protein [Flavisolibacter nicotianae]|uniref:hypothetical protein n=1 Tax=Flavisolibacter nicotianae TaxID=2364882 RepID=UPI0013C506D1|nr:hypothetical protein [Flavisolibacter nicotianae]
MKLPNFFHPQPQGYQHDQRTRGEQTKGDPPFWFAADPHHLYPLRLGPHPDCAGHKKIEQNAIPENHEYVHERFKIFHDVKVKKI